MRETGVGFRTRLSYAERSIFRELHTLLTGENSVIVDVGASEGTYSAVFAKTSSVSAVYAFEPLPGPFAKLVAAVRDYQFVQCFNFALGDTNGEEMMHEYSYSDVSSLLKMEENQERLLPPRTVSSERTVRVRRLDELVMAGDVAQPDLIKIDVQGYEGRVLRGAERTLQHTRYCLIEMSFVPMYEGAWLFGDMYEFMKRRGFRLVAVAGPIAGPLGAAPQVDGVFRREGV
jgi:FkbM family methyltransferase